MVNAASVDEVNKMVRPQQLAVGESMGCEKKIWTMKLLQQQAKQLPGGWAIMIALDMKNAFQTIDKVAAQEVMDQWAEDVPALTPLARLHRASVGQPVDGWGHRGSIRGVWDGGRRRSLVSK